MVATWPPFKLPSSISNGQTRVAPTVKCRPNAPATCPLTRAPVPVTPRPDASPSDWMHPQSESDRLQQVSREDFMWPDMSDQGWPDSPCVWSSLDFTLRAMSPRLDLGIVSLRHPVTCLHQSLVKTRGHVNTTLLTGRTLLGSSPESGRVPSPPFF
jgi:hypothetical protein